MTIVPKGEAFLSDYSIRKLTDAYHRERDAKAKIRLLAAIYRKEEKTYDEISLALKYPLTTIRDWLSLIHMEGISRKNDLKQTGKPKRLTDEQIKKLKPILLKSPEEQGFTFIFWTTRLVIQLIKKLYDVSYKPLQVRRILHRLGLSCQKPRPTHKKASKKAQEDFKRNFRERVQQYTENGYEILFLDESIFPIKPYLTYGWFLKGSQPVVKYEHKRRDKYCVMGALNSDHFIYELSDKLNSDIFKNFLVRLIDQFKKVVIVIDHGPYHVSKNMQEFYAENREHLHVEYFPSYSHELDPIEQS